MVELRAQHRDLGRGGWARLFPRFVSKHAHLMDTLVESLPLRQEPITMFGKTHLTPRLTSWHGDADASYCYSRRKFEPLPWTPELTALREHVVAATGYAFNSVLVNYYRDGQDAMGEHADDEPELGPTRDDVGIGSVSLGDRRRFVLRPRGAGERVVYNLGEGDLLLMGGTAQSHFKHAIPRTRKHVGPRLNLTFRVVRTSSRSPVNSPR